MSQSNDIRPALEADAPAACALVRASITMLCGEDHGGDALTLEGWLVNKTPANLARWFASPGISAFIAERGGVMTGVGAVRDDGEIMLAYVCPRARFLGVTSALLARMEESARAKHAGRMTLTTTLTARRFYLARGYAAGEDEEDFFEEGPGALVKNL